MSYVEVSAEYDGDYRGQCSHHQCLPLRGKGRKGGREGGREGRREGGSEGKMEGGRKKDRVGKEERSREMVLT